MKHALMTSTLSQPGAAMHRFRRRPLLAIASLLPLALAAMGAISGQTRSVLRPGDLAALKAGQPAQVQRVLENLLDRRGELGLGSQGGFQVRHAFTNAEGQVVAHVAQTFSGRRVWGAGAIAHVRASGEIVTQTAAVRPGVAVLGEPSVTADQAKAIALRHFAALGCARHACQRGASCFPERLHRRHRLTLGQGEGPTGH